MDMQYATYAAQQAAALLGIDSPSGFTDRAAAWVLEAFRNLGFEAKQTTKGGVLIDLGGRNAEDALLLEAHTDTLGAMVAEIKGSGKRPGLYQRRKSSGGHLPAVQRLCPRQWRVLRYQTEL